MLSPLAVMDLTLHRIKPDRVIVTAKEYDGTQWIIIEFDENHSLTLFASSPADFEALCAKFNAQPEVVV